MRRRLFTAASLVSLLLCVGTAVLWVATYWRSFSVDWYQGSMGCQHLGRVQSRPSGRSVLATGKLPKTRQRPSGFQNVIV